MVPQVTVAPYKDRGAPHRFRIERAFRDVTARIYPGMGHLPHNDEVVVVRELPGRLVS